MNSRWWSILLVVVTFALMPLAAAGTAIGLAVVWLIAVCREFAKQMVAAFLAVFAGLSVDRCLDEYIPRSTKPRATTMNVSSRSCLTQARTRTF